MGVYVRFSSTSVTPTIAGLATGVVERGDFVRGKHAVVYTRLVDGTGKIAGAT